MSNIEIIKEDFMEAVLTGEQLKQALKAFKEAAKRKAIREELAMLGQAKALRGIK